jgi:hypothetical protein
MSQRLTVEEKRRQKQQATIGLASNILGISAGTAALAASARNKAFKNPDNANNAGPVTSKILTKIKMSPKNKKRLILAGAGGAVGLQAANLGGDLVTNRVLAREVKKNDMTMISKAEGAVSRNGHGKSLVEKGLPSVLTNTAPRSGLAHTRVEAHLTGKKIARIKSAIKANPGSIVTEPSRVGLGAVASPSRDKKKAKNLKSKYKEDLDWVLNRSRPVRGISNPSSYKASGVGKAYRRFDPEADRQRRMGQAQGVSLATGILAGAGAKKHFTTELKHKGKDVLGIAAKPGQGRRGVALAGLSAIATAGGLASYKRSLSVRNQPWT